MTRKKKPEEIDYIRNASNNLINPPSSRTVIKMKMIGNTVVRRIIDKNYQPPLVDLQGFSIF